VEQISVIVSTSNQASHARRALESVNAAVEFLTRQPGTHDVKVEVVVVDDGSEDTTRTVLEDYTRGRADYQLMLRGGNSSPGCVRNLGVSISSGDPIFFLDGDDLFLENHLHECLTILKAHDDIQFVKTQVVLSDPVHPDWVARITNSVVINLCVRRNCHDLVGGFPDVHLFRRVGDRFDHYVDIFHAIDDVFYNKKIASVCRGWIAPLQTVQHVRRPGNSFDRHYERFQSPPTSGRPESDELYDMRVEIAKLLIDYEIEALKKRPSD
jgi:glycosyltransferase involved in cell wall biosynthesis